MNSLRIEPSDYWLSVAEASARSGSGLQNMRKLIRNGQIMAMKRYGQWLINTRSLQNYMRLALPQPLLIH